MGRSYPADTRHQARPPPAGGGGATTPRRLEQPSQHRRSPAEPLLVSPLPLSRGPRSPFGSSALPTSSPAVLVSSIRPIERIDDHHPSTPRLTTPPVNPDASDAATNAHDSSDAATNVAQPSPVSPLPSTCKSAASVIVPVPRLLSLDAQFPPPPARPPHKPVVRRPPSPPLSKLIPSRSASSGPTTQHVTTSHSCANFDWISRRRSPLNRSPPSLPVPNFVPPLSSPPSCLAIHSGPASASESPSAPSSP